MNPVYGADSSKSTKFIPSQRRNITVLQPENHTWTSCIGLCQTLHGTIWGAYVQANHETNQTNSNASRMLDTIYHRPVNSMQGSHELYDLNSGRVITKARETQIPVTDVVIKAIK
jgi:hypothetical protein